MTLRALNYGNYGIFLIMGNAGFISLNPIESLKEPLKGTLIDPFKGTPGFCPSTVLFRLLLGLARAPTRSSGS